MFTSDKVMKVNYVLIIVRHSVLLCEKMDYNTGLKYKKKVCIFVHYHILQCAQNFLNVTVFLIISLNNNTRMKITYQIVYVISFMTFNNFSLLHGLKSFAL